MNPAYHILLISPQGYPHAQGLLEMGKLLQYSFESLGISCTLGSNTYDPARRNIMLGYHMLDDPAWLAAHPCIVYQLEQLSDREGWFNRQRQAVLQAAAEVWDYCPQNEAFLHAKGIRNVKLLPIGFHEKMQTIPPAEADIDVLFYGSVNPRRRAVLDPLGKQCKLQTLFGVYGEERDRFIARSRIILNLHFYEAQIMEQVRVSYLLNNRCFVISEDSPDNPYPDCLITASHDRLVETCLHWLRVPDERAALAQAGFAEFARRPMADNLRAVLQQPSRETVQVAPTRDKPPVQQSPVHQAVLQAVPGNALRILDVGCGDGTLGAALKAKNPARTVLGIESEPAVAASARVRLDEVFVQGMDAPPPVPPGSLDCIIYSDVLEHLVDPETVLRRHRPLLKPDGSILCCISNMQHHSVVSALLRGDLQYVKAGLLDTNHLRFFTYATIFKLLLNAGFAPDILARIEAPASAEFSQAAEPLLKLLGLHPQRTGKYLGTYQYLFGGRPYPADGNSYSPTEVQPLSFVVCESNQAVLQANLLSSPCLAAGSPHEVIVTRNCANAAEGLNRGLAAARNEVVICLHQDVWLPQAWPVRFWEQYNLASALHGKLGVAGVFGVSFNQGMVRRAGHVVNCDHMLWEPPPLPALVDTLDEVLLAVRKDSGFRFDPSLGFHFYGADICLATREACLPTVVLDALCFHNSAGTVLPPDFAASQQVFARKWAARLPVATTCVTVTSR